MKARALSSACAAGLLSLVVWPSTAIAVGFSVSDLGVVDGKSSCMARAISTVQHYAETLGAEEVEPQNWSVYGWGLRPGDQDVVILCSAPATAGNDFRRALLVVYGNATDSDRNATRDVLKGYWNEN